MMTELLAHGNDRVVRAMSGALRNLAIDARNRDLLGERICDAELFHTQHGGRTRQNHKLSSRHLQVNTPCLIWWPTCLVAARVSR